MLSTIFFANVLLFLIASSCQEEILKKYYIEDNNNVMTKLFKSINSTDLTKFKFKNNTVEHGIRENNKRSKQPNIEEEKKTVTSPAVKKVRFTELPEEQTPKPKRKANKTMHSRNTFDFTKTISKNSEDINNRIYIPSYKLNITWNIDNLGNMTDLPRKVDERSTGLPIPLHNCEPPDYFDWRDQNAVSPVKDQQRCQACWAFSAVANIESMLKIYLKKEYVLSEQFLIDCDYDSGGCRGGAPLLSVFSFIVSKLGGVLKYHNYDPYTAQQHKCKYKAPPPYPIPVVGMHRVPQDEDAMVQYLYKYGPLSAAINSKSMDDYNTDHGVYIDEPTDKQCPKHKLDHTILIVGYNVYVDTSSGASVPYWIIKNSWGSNWGDNGFYYLVRGRNACGIASDVSFASVV